MMDRRVLWWRHSVQRQVTTLRRNERSGVTADAEDSVGPVSQDRCLSVGHQISERTIDECGFGCISTVTLNVALADRSLEVSDGVRGRPRVEEFPGKEDDCVSWPADFKFEFDSE